MKCNDKWNWNFSYLAITQAFVATCDASRKERHTVFSCDHCPMVWYNKLCQEIEGKLFSHTCWEIFLVYGLYYNILHSYFRTKWQEDARHNIVQAWNVARRWARDCCDKVQGCRSMHWCFRCFRNCWLQPQRTESVFNDAAESSLRGEAGQTRSRHSWKQVNII